MFKPIENTVNKIRNLIFHKLILHLQQFLQIPILTILGNNVTIIRTMKYIITSDNIFMV